MGQPNRRRTKTTTVEVFPTVQGFRGLCPCKKQPSHLSRYRLTENRQPKFMSNNSILFPHEQTPAETEAALAELTRALRMPPPVAPEAALNMLYEAACQDSGGSQAARNFLFWLAGQPDPTGFVGDGGIELRRLDGQLKKAAFQAIEWWAGPTQSDQPLYDVLGKLRRRFSAQE